MKKGLLFTTFGILFLLGDLFAQPNVFNPNDTLVTYNPANPPVTPPANTIAKWVRTVRMTWNTDKFKSYYYNGVQFRLRFPNGYNPSDPNKKYPMILFFHGGGENAGVTDNEYHLFNGAQLFDSLINQGQFNSFMLFPQTNNSFDYFYLQNLNNIIDSLQKYCNLDPDRLISMGLSAGAYSSIDFSKQFPQRVAATISSSPALIDILNGNPDYYIHVPFWLSSGGTDANPNPNSVQTFVNNFNAKGGDIRWSFFPDLGHATWYQQWAEPYLVPTWNLAHKANPLVFFQRTKYRSDSTINTRLGITSGFFQYQWQRNNIDIPAATGNEYTATQFGTYRVRFKRFSYSNFSDWSPIPAVISLDDSPPTAPTNLTSVYTGKNFVTLDWNNSSDNSGVTGYQVFMNGTLRSTTAESGITVDNLAPSTTYTFYVRALDQAGNISTVSPTIPATTAATVTDLKYRYYEGSWNLLPNFNSLTPVKSGSTPNVDISVRNINNNFGIVWEGYINLPTAGTYRFETNSDDGSKMYFNKFYSNNAVPLVANDGIHGPRTIIGAVDIQTPGLYPIAFTFFEKESGEVMEVYWSGPGIPRQLIPNSAFREVVVDNIPPSAPTGLRVVTAGSTFVDLDWNDATDNIGVTGYDVYVNNVKTITTTTSNGTISSLAANTSYTITIKALDLATNSSAFSSPLLVTTSPGSAGGLRYRYYEGAWDLLPNFNTLPVLKQGTTPNIDLSVRNINDNFGMVWEGYINIQTAGTYTFETVSDDGSKLYFNTAYSPTATALVNNDGLHAARPATGTVNITTPGFYPISMAFFERDGGETMQVYWTGPGITRQLIPNIAFTENTGADITPPSAPFNLRSITTGSTFVDLDWDNSTDNVEVTGYDLYINNIKTSSPTASNIVANNLIPNTTYTFTVKARDAANNNSAFSNSLTLTTSATSTGGLKYRYYHGTWDVLPNFNAQTIVKQGTTPNIDLSVRTANDTFGLVWEGYINIKTAGIYTFETISDDGSKLYFNTFYAPSATALVTNDGLHAARSATGTVNITTPGIYPIAMTFFERDGGETMQVYWTGPGITRQLIPNAAFTEAGVPGSININLQSGLAEAGQAGMALTNEDIASAKIMKAYPNPVGDVLNIDFYNKSRNSKVSVGLFDLNGKLIRNQYFGNLASGRNIVKMSLKNNNLAPGIFLVKITVDGKSSAVIKLVKATR